MVSEFDFINNIKSKYALGKIGDDCAVLPKDGHTDLLITADMLVEDVDFRLEWTAPEFLGHKSLAVSLSDIAAMGGTPTFAMLSIAVPDALWKTKFLDRFYEGWHKLAEQFNVELIGGDVSRSPTKLVIDSTVLGEVRKGKAILRSGAGIGDAVFVTGFLGAAAAGLQILESGQRFNSLLPPIVKHLMFHQLQPLAQVKTGILLQIHGLVTAMLDISDGVSSDIFHLVNASQVGCRIDLDSVPVDPAIVAGMPCPPDDLMDFALNGGEDFELLLTVAEKNISAVQDLGFHRIGDITDNVGVVELNSGGKKSLLSPKGYRHF